MIGIGSEIGGYLDPALVDTALAGDPVDDLNPSWEGEPHSFPGGEVPLVDGRIAIVDSNGVIVGYR